MRGELDTIDHVLRGALNTILLNLQVLAASPERDDGARDLLARASAEVRRLAAELLPATFRILSLEITELRSVDLGRLVEQARRDRGLEGTPGTRPGPTVLGDPELLATAVGQLVDNAVAATPPGAVPPRIAVERGGGGAAAVVVRNACAPSTPPLTAEGIPAARRHLGGVLAAMRIARLHRGALTYERREEELVARLSIPGLAAGGSEAADAARLRHASPRRRSDRSDS